MRSTPTVNAEQVGRMEPGDRFEVLDGPVCGDGYAWVQVNYGGIIGWTAIGDDEDYWIEPLPGLAAFDGSACIVEASTTVNRRSAPDVNATVAGQFIRGSMLDVIGQKTDAGGFIWWKLGDNSWVRNDSIQIGGNCAQVPQAE